MSPNRLSTVRLRPLRCAAALALLAFTLAAHGQASPRVVKKVPLEFPERAINQGVTKGVLKARVSVDAEGAVTGVDVVDAQPTRARLLNDTVATGLRGWRFEPSGKAQTFDLQIVLSAD